MKISVVISTYNRGNHLNYGLRTLLAQNRIPDEVLIIDDGGTDHTEGIVKGIKNDFPNDNIRYIYNYNPGYTNCCLAKNIGIKEATGDLIIFTEPEILHVGETIATHEEWHKNNGGLFVSTATVYFVFGTALKELTLEHYKNPLLIITRDNIVEWEAGYQPKAEDIAVSRCVRATYCASVKKGNLEYIGGFDERFLPHWGWDDIDLQSRLGMAGIKCICDSTIQVVHLAHGYTGCYEKWHFNKELNDDPDKPTVANEDVDWGVIIPVPEGESE